MPIREPTLTSTLATILTSTTNKFVNNNILDDKGNLNLGNKTLEDLKNLNETDKFVIPIIDDNLNNINPKEEEFDIELNLEVINKTLTIFTSYTTLTTTTTSTTTTTTTITMRSSTKTPTLTTSNTRISTPIKTVFLL